MLRIKELREEKGLKQKELASLLGIPPNTLNQYENHKREPDQSTLCKLADFFNVSTDHLLGRSSIVDNMCGCGPVYGLQEAIIKNFTDKVPNKIKKKHEISTEDFELLNQIKQASPDKQKAIELILGIKEQAALVSSDK